LVNGEGEENAQISVTAQVARKNIAFPAVKNG
jgi:hypothetical protein